MTDEGSSLTLDDDPGMADIKTVKGAVYANIVSGMQHRKDLSINAQGGEVVNLPWHNVNTSQPERAIVFLIEAFVNGHCSPFSNQDRNILNQSITDNPVAKKMSAFFVGHRATKVANSL